MQPKIDRRKFLIATGAAAGLTAVSTGHLNAKAACVRVTALRAEYLDRPMGVENRRPQLSWRLESKERNVRQTAYHILIASSAEVLLAGRGDLWDSGKIHSRKSFGIRYQGRELASRERCYWRVKVWDESDESSLPSAISWWEMGLLDPTEWVAQWLAVEDPVAKADRETGLHWIWGQETKSQSKQGFRLRFSLPTAVSEGELFIVANDWPVWTQITRAWIDGEPIAGPGAWVTDVNQSGVTESSSFCCKLSPLIAGEHVVAVQVDTSAFPNWGEDLHLDDFQLKHAVAGLLRLNVENGAVLRLTTGPDWRTAVIVNDEWASPTFDDKSWAAAKPVALRYQPWPPAPAMWLRRSFAVPKPLARARLYVTALGAYEARLNGLRIGDALLTPEPSYYAKHVLYRAHDVTTLVRKGDNALGLTVGDGWYASFDGNYAFGPPPRRALAQLELNFEDGTRMVIGTGPGWRITDSSIRESQIRVGEVQDARLEQPGWDTAHFDDSRWTEAQIAETPSCSVVAQIDAPIRALKYIKPRSIAEPKPGLYVFDFGQNFSGWCRLRVKGPRGTRVELTHAELLSPTGEIEQPYSNIGMPKKDVYILKGDPASETFEPHFSYRGFRYVQVNGLPAVPTADALTGVFIHTDLPKTGAIRSDHPLITDLWQSVVRTHYSNLVGLPTDTPSREQRSYSEVDEIIWDGASYDSDMAAFTVRVMDVFVDNQSREGDFPRRILTPLYNNAMEDTAGSTPGHGEAAIVLPWIAWQRYGDTAIVERYWAAMNRHVQFILDNNPDHIWRNKRGHDEGDWFALDVTDSDSTLPHTPKDLVGTAFLAYSLDLLAQMAAAIGQPTEAIRLRGTWDKVKSAFGDTFVKPDGTIGNGSQTSYILALRFDLIPDHLVQAAADRLVANIRSRGVSLTTGIFGTQFVLDALANVGRAEVAYDLLLRTDYPSWGYMVRNGATTIWETWSGSVKSSGRNGVEVSQMGRNHPDLASLSGFLFRSFAGIEGATPGFETINIRPILDPRLKKGGGDYDSIMGRISTDWSQHSDGRFSLDVRIPANTRARVHVPAQPRSRITEGRMNLAHHPDIHSVQRHGMETVIDIGSGSYRFVVEA